jgi:hypothetical protein
MGEGFNKQGTMSEVFKYWTIFLGWAMVKSRHDG